MYRGTRQATCALPPSPPFQRPPPPPALQALSADNYPELRVMLCIGGIDPKPMYEMLRRGCHSVVATPGRLKVGVGVGVGGEARGFAAKSLINSDPTCGVARCRQLLFLFRHQWRRFAW